MSVMFVCNSLQNLPDEVALLGLDTIRGSAIDVE
jgi:hypothetical protein